MNALPSDPGPGSDDRFPAPVYARTVLAPAFAHSQEHHLRHLLRLHRAHGVMLAEQKLLTRDEAAAIFGALDTVETELTGAAPAAYTGEHEDLFFFVETKLAALIGKDVAGRLHTGRSRNDIDHTLFKLQLRERLDALGLQLLHVITTLIRRAREEAGTLILAYTHGQPAQPSTYGHYLGALIEVLLRDVTRLAQAREVVDLSTMGAAAITTTGFPLDRGRVAALLGFPGFQRNSYGCIASCDYTAGVYSALRILALNIGRFAQDLAFWTSFEVGQLRFSDGFVQISSIMPQKRNPVPVEHLRLMASLTAGKCDAVLLALHNTPFTDMNDNEHEVHGQGYEAFTMAERALGLLGGVVASAKIDEARARANIEASYATITELADTLVRREALPFAITHHVAAAMAKHLQATGQTLGTVPYAEFASLFHQVVGRAPALTEAEFREAVTPEHFVAVRTLPGGPAPVAMAKSLALYEAQAETAQRLIVAHAERDAAAQDGLARAIASFSPAKG
ncbi:argininosuccinate lyase [Bosea sp. (in: a-proteobacteria)]|jgi:argininosuccinate lyase|uniref:argininosuccinate lyase n=1 Tax=Bosea sp. (in: a-proteobacteria) TaxID=1871050 RepID=UPI003F724A1D